MDLLPGFAQGITRVFISYPFDYIKTHLQMNKVDNISSFLKHNSILNMYRGVSIPLCTVPVDRAIQFKLYEYLNKNNNPFISGISCGIVSCLTTLPITNISNNYILNNNETNLKNFIVDRFRNNRRDFFNGFRPEILRLTISSSIYLGVYGNLRNKFGNGTLQCAINSSIAGISLWTVVYPLDTLKIEQQVNNNSKLYDIFKTRIKNHGIINLWKGILPVYARTLPSSIIGMLVYEKIRESI